MNRKYVASFPVDIRKEPAQLIDISKNWIAESQYSPFRFASFKEGKTEYNSQGHSITFKQVETQDEEVVGVLYTKPGEIKGSNWTTRIVGSKNEDSFQVGVEVLYSGEKLPYEAKKPKLINKILHLMGGDQGRDGSILVPKLQSYDLQGGFDFTDTIKSILTGRTGNSLPVIYVSNDYYGISQLGEDGIITLGEELAGVAHVIIEPNRLFTKKLNSNSNIAAHNGAIGIYWANGMGRELLLPSHLVSENKTSLDSNGIIEMVSSKVREGNLDKNLADVHWDRIARLEHKLLIEELKQNSSEKDSDLFNLYEVMLSDKEKELEQAKMDNSKLEGMLRIFNTQNVSGQQSGNTVSTLGKGIEVGYSGEVLDIIGYAVDLAVKTTHEKSQRKIDVLTKVQENLVPMLEDSQREEELDELKKVLTYEKFNSKVERGLRNLGFEVKKGGKHMKITRNGITGTIPLTPGDTAHGSENRFSDIRQKFY